MKFLPHDKFACSVDSAKLENKHAFCEFRTEQNTTLYLLRKNSRKSTKVFVFRIIFLIFNSI